MSHRNGKAGSGKKLKKKQKEPHAKYRPMLRWGSVVALITLFPTGEFDKLHRRRTA